MRNQNFIFVTFCLILAMGFLQLRFVLDKIYGNERELKKQVEQSHLQIEKQKMLTLKFQDQVQDMQAHLASQTWADKLAGADWLRSMRSPASVKKIDLSTVFFEEASKTFQQSNYIQTLKTLKEMLDKYPTSPKAIDARFLLAESYYRLNLFPECLDQVDEMISQFPDNKLTGYLMVRMGQIFQSQNQTEKAKEIFRIVKHNFSSERPLVQQAETLYRNLEK